MNKEKMTVKEFMKKYNALTNAELKKNYVVSVVKNQYMPYENKVTICQKIVEATYYITTKDKDGNERRKLHVNSTAKYMLYCLNIVNTYTSIEINFKNSLEEFNLLNGSECLDLIFQHIPDREKQEFRKILDLVESDLMQNEYEIHAFISNQVERFGELTSATLSPLLKMLIEQVANLDEDKLDKILKAILK